TDANWDAADCSNGPSKSVMPPGLVNGFSAFRAIPPSGNSAYSGRFNSCAGGPYTTAAQIRIAVMDRANWLFDNNGAGLSIPSTCDLSIPASTPVSIYEKLYWPNYEARKIESKSLSGGSREDVVLNTSVTNYGATGIAVDAVGGKVYWFDEDRKSVGKGMGERDGSGREVEGENTGDADSFGLD